MMNDETGPGRSRGDQFEIGVQSYSFRNFSFEGSLKQLEALGLSCMEFCAVHFPPDKDAPGFGTVLKTLRDAGVTVPAFGVEQFTDDVDANRRKFEFAKALGAGILSADPSPESFDNLETLCEEFDIEIAIHNHGPEARYDKVADTLDAVSGRNPKIGACVDTGHALRSSEMPDEVIRRLGERVVLVHLKDWRVGGDEQILGEGDMDLAGVAKALKEIGFAGPLIIEYENSPDNPVPDMKKGLANWRRAVEQA